ncbi:AAA family ATPase [Agrobacterium larrymoorei]|uniref:ATPase n=1 Tax=Agrobacterium larrymoorei TaxID=160699 RepID=A0ABU0UPD6_9HYPH|nr:AAA family ATPase [Agrobacterium larrymoorei]MDQ1186802.1 putative ATPase [Agrobacterium larrymoorei]
MDKLVILSGCSGGGKSTLLSELSKRGCATVEEPGRRVVEQQLKAGGTALPWVDLKAFLHQAVAIAEQDYAAAREKSDFSIFDRSLIDAASALRQLGDDDWYDRLRNEFRYAKIVFLTPPWPEIYVTDNERRHGFQDAVEEYERLRRDYGELGYDVVILPKTDIEDRVEFVLKALQCTQGT